MILATHANVGIYLIRVFFSLIDTVVYWALMEIYKLIDVISKVNIFGEGTLDEFSTRIYTIISVLMVFKLAFSIISYIVDPDKLADSKKGFSSVVKNIIIMLALIVTVPLIFKYAMALQYIVISDNTIGRLITGREGATTTNVGNNMAVAILSGFIHPDNSLMTGCENYSPECEEALSKYDLNDEYHWAYKGENGYTYLIDLARSKETFGDGNYVITYNIILSTLVGGFTAYILLMFCIEIAVRTVKLGFLQLIAPIPIVTYMDDGGQGMFKKWVNTCVSTYADLFVRLAAIDFAIYIISAFLISNDGNGNFKVCQWSFSAGSMSADCSESPGFFVKIFLILGTLMFAKQLPKLIEEITGLKLGGSFSLNPMKKLAEVPLLGGLGAAGLGLAGSAALAGGRLGTGLIKGVGAGIGSAFRGNGFKSGFGSSMSADVSRAGARMKAGFSAAGGTIKSNWDGNGKYDSAGAKYKSMMHGKDATSMALGKQLYSRYSNEIGGTDASGRKIGEPAAYADRYKNLLRNSEMARVAGNLDAAKDRRNALQSRYEKMQNDLRNGVGDVTSDMVDKARVDYVKASSDYDKVSAEFSRLKSEHSSDAERYDAYMKYADSVEAQARVSGFDAGDVEYHTSSSSSNSTSTSSSNSTSTSSSTSSTSSSSSSSTSNSTNYSEEELLQMMSDGQRTARTNEKPSPRTNFDPNNIDG